jgi:hypothetical protein
MRLALLAATSLAGLVLLSGAASAAPKPDCFETDLAGPCYSTFHDVFIDDGDELVGEYFHGRWDPEDAFPGDVCPMLGAPM